MRGAAAIIVNIASPVEPIRHGSETKTTRKVDRLHNTCACMDGQPKHERSKGKRHEAEKKQRRNREGTEKNSQEQTGTSCRSLGRFLPFLVLSWITDARPPRCDRSEAEKPLPDGLLFIGSRTEAAGKRSKNVETGRQQAENPIFRSLSGDYPEFSAAIKIPCLAM